MAIKNETPLNSFKINYLTEEMYQEASRNGLINENELYLTPEGNVPKNILTTNGNAGSTLKLTSPIRKDKMYLFYIEGWESNRITLYHDKIIHGMSLLHCLDTNTSLRLMIDTGYIDLSVKSNASIAIFGMATYWVTQIIEL